MKITAFTNALRTALVLTDKCASVIVSGGKVRPTELAVSGALALENMAEFNVDKMAKNVAKRAMEELRDNGVIVGVWIPIKTRPMTEEERKEWIDNLDGSLLFTQHLTWEEVRKACIRFLKLNEEYCHEIKICDDDFLVYITTANGFDGRNGNKRRRCS